MLLEQEQRYIMEAEKQNKIDENNIIKLGNLSQEDLNNQEEKEDQEKKRNLRKIALHFIRVRDDYYKIVQRPDKSGKLYKDLLRLSKTTITDDYTKGILRYINKYDDFTLVASHIDYQQVINGFYNQYHEITHKPTQGDCTNIFHILTHIFGESHIDFILDYLQILYTNPNQCLPIILIESSEKNTGKTTVSNLFYWIFQYNAIKLGNSDLQSEFGGFWLQRLLIIVDETSLEKQGVTQMLKRLSTETGKVTSNEKNKAQREVDFIGKFIFLSNDEGKALQIERGDPRWAVFKAPTFAEKGYKDNPNISEQIKQEIPAFLHFLMNRTLVHPLKSRMYFDPDVYRTSQLMLYYENSISLVAQAIKQLVKDTFAMFPDETELKFSVTNIMDELKGNVRNLDRKKVRQALEKELNLKELKKNEYTYLSLASAERGHTSNTTSNNVTFQFLKNQDS
jgi:Family of unknown function (DUF5906)